MAVLRALGIFVILVQTVAIPTFGTVLMAANQTPASLENFDDLFVGNQPGRY